MSWLKVHLFIFFKKNLDPPDDWSLLKRIALIKSFSASFNLFTLAILFVIENKDAKGEMTENASEGNRSNPKDPNI